MTTLEPTDIDQARQYFDRSRGCVVEVTTGLSDAQWRFKPAPDRWSIAQSWNTWLSFTNALFGRV